MTLIDILISASCGAAVVGSLWAGLRFYRSWQADKALADALAEAEEEARFDVEVHPLLKAEADRLAQVARKARHGHRESKELAARALEARNIQLRCEQRLRAAGYGHPVLGEAA